MNTACQLGNGVSVAYNPDLAVDRLTQDLLALFAEAGATEPERALSAFAQRLAAIPGNHFEALLGPISTTSEALRHLPDLAALAAEAPARVTEALGTVSDFLQRVYRVGMAIALGHVAERSIGGDFDAGAWSVAARLIELGPASRLSVGTLNYDGLLHAGLMDVGRDEWGRPTFMIADLADGRTLRNFEVVPGHSLVGYPIRVVDDFPPDRACLIQMHGSLGWLRSPDDPSQVWRFTLGELRAAGYWRAWRDGRTEWSPVVVLTDRKENATRAWPFALAYDSFLRRLTTADRWLIAGYGMGDTPVNLVFKTATIERRRQGRPPIPPTLIVGYNEPPEGLAARAAERLGLKMDRVAVTAAGVPAAFDTDEWRQWAAGR